MSKSEPSSTDCCSELGGAPCDERFLPEGNGLTVSGITYPPAGGNLDFSPPSSHGP